MNYFTSFVKRLWNRQRKQSPRQVAKARLEKVLVKDRIEMEPKYLDSVRRDLLKAIGKHMQIDKQELTIEVTSDGAKLLLSVKAPVRKFRRNGAAKVENCYEMVKTNV